MHGLKLILWLWLRSFSFRKDSLRRPTAKRVIVILFAMPAIVFHVLWTHLFLKLDDLFFPEYRFQNADSPVFILGLPRSGTSFLLSLMAGNRREFTAFQLWEMIFAPSVIQKLFFLKVGRFLAETGLPVKAMVKRLDNFLFTKIQGIHDLRLLAVEEDELLFMYLFQSAYLIFLFPELEGLHRLLEPGKGDDLSKRNMAFYRSLVKRHLYVFDRRGQKCFLSKNPMHAIRLNALPSVFPASRYLFIRRPLEESIPSMISLNQHLYRHFGSEQAQNPLRAETIETLLKWDSALRDFKGKTSLPLLEIDFKQLIKRPSGEAQRIHRWLNIPVAGDYWRFLESQDEFSENYSSRHRYRGLTAAELSRLAGV